MLSRYVMGAENDKVVDHLDGNTLDNRRINLRVVTRSENMKNRKDNANIGHRNIKRIDGKYEVWISLGEFDTKEAAWNACIDAMKKLPPYESVRFTISDR